MGFLDDLFGGSSSGGSSGGGFWSSVGPALISSGVGLLGGIFQSESQEDQLEAAKDEKQKDRILELQLAELREKYGVGKGGGGGGGGGGVDRTAALLNAYQNYIASNRAGRDRQSQAYQELSRSVTAPLLK